MKQKIRGKLQTEVKIGSCFMIIILTIIPLFINISAYATSSSILRSSEEVYVPGDELVLYGKMESNDVLIARVFDPTGRAIRIDNINTDSDGFFREEIFEWPQPSKNLAFGVYTIQVSSSKGETLQIEVTFAEGAQQDSPVPRTPKTHILSVKMDAPAQVSVNSTFRIYVQITFDGALVDTNEREFLSSSHIHSGRGNSTINIPDFIKLHEGLYYTDVVLNTEGPYVIHSAAFYRGYLSHDSRVVTAATTSINTIQDSVNRLDGRLNSTNHELSRLETRLEETRSALTDTETSIKNSLEDASSSIKEDIDEAALAVENLENASGQVNSIILPVLALISVIIALQISLFARIRASYR